MKCELCEERLLEYLYGELPPEEANRMERHLAASEPCRQVAESFRSVLEAVRQVDEEHPPPALHTRIMAHAEEKKPTRADRRLWAWLLRPAVVSPLVLIAAAGLYLLTIRTPDPRLERQELLGRRPAAPKEERVRPPRRLDFAERSSAPMPERKTAPASPLEKEIHEAPPLPRALPESSVLGLGAGEKAAGHAAPPSPPPASRPARANRDAEARFRAKASARAPLPRAEEDRVDNDAGAAGRIVGQERLSGLNATRATAVDLASEGSCAEARARLEAHARAHPEDPVNGEAWLAVARCFADRGESEAARSAAEEALRAPASRLEAQAFLRALQADQKAPDARRAIPQE